MKKGKSKLTESNNYDEVRLCIGINLLFLTFWYLTLPCKCIKWNTVVSNDVNSDRVPSFSYLDVQNVRKTASGVYAITVTSTNHSHRCNRL